MSFPNSNESAQPAVPAAPAAQTPAQPVPSQYVQPHAQPQYTQPQYAPPQYAPQPPTYQAPVRAPMSGLAIATLIVSFFAGLPAVVMGVFALRQIWVRGMRGTGIAWAGIIIGAIVCVAQVSFFILMGFVAASSAVS
ncbi:DUF4190 domain-containing protein [Leucobacter sp. UT-8R-CII-1-4]|uniref:DUF4190 domain-containing protein n=1 Tax=Leucobacter sp. UT-8R-CII-1-4 TaxID=3040075 RepID=UPI0024A87EDE|nr:DUF4190 domain-containing protein [Leucobacter sp. UT-8R-CII-1-4]MDI6022137.1 DUF4190 domain-containing protein [Leucobacter sp. UT-8R-CII-1-4]